jgi:hypothetical protein
MENVGIRFIRGKQKLDRKKRKRGGSERKRGERKQMVKDLKPKI